MTVVMTMQGGLEPIMLEDGFLEAANQLNNAGARGMSFIMTRTDEGDNILIHMDNILTMKEIND